MLIERIRDVYREFVNPVVTSEAITTIPANRPAANSSIFEKNEVQARRQRRQRRINRAAGKNMNGWAVRTW